MREPPVHLQPNSNHPVVLNTCSDPSSHLIWVPRTRKIPPRTLLYALPSVVSTLPNAQTTSLVPVPMCPKYDSHVPVFPTPYLCLCLFLWQKNSRLRRT